MFCLSDQDSVAHTRAYTHTSETQTATYSWGLLSLYAKIFRHWEACQLSLHSVHKTHSLNYAFGITVWQEPSLRLVLKLDSKYLQKANKWFFFFFFSENLRREIKEKQET